MSISDTQLTSSLENMILSASGWRKVFAPGGDDSLDRIPSPADRLLAAGMGQAWGHWISRHLDLDKPVILVATDTRPTGPVLAEMLMRGLESAGCTARYVGVAAAPEAMARSSRDRSINGFAYVSASHNPPGHNGVKFGIGGGVIGGSDAKELITEYRKLIGTTGIAETLGAAAAFDNLTLPPTPRDSDVAEKERCLETYRQFQEEIAGGPGNESSRNATVAALRKALAGNPVRIIADLNGSARCVSADRACLEGLGAQLDTFNDIPGQIVHTILPEGESLEPCRQALEKAHRNDANALIGYVPDNDGDRGNLVIWDRSINGARALEAQEVFALSTLAEFACAAWGEDPGISLPRALVVNGPTSHRVREIAAAYGAEVHEAEVGEANVVNRAAELRREGYQVRLLGEGSNGGTITHPAEVRDPLNTITALLKLLRLPSESGRQAPFEDWCRRIGRPEAYHPGFGPADIVATLPVFTTTPASEARALAGITTGKHCELKTTWEHIFASQWSVHKKALKEAYGFTGWIELNNEGTSSREGTGPENRSGACSGGLKILFHDKENRDAGFLWMRGSGTEPVFRVMAEIRGNRPEAEKALALWQGGMAVAADRLLMGITENSDEIPSPVAD